MLTYADVCLQVSTSGCNIREAPTLHRSVLLLFYYCTLTSAPPNPPFVGPPKTPPNARGRVLAFSLVAPSSRALTSILKLAHPGSLFFRSNGRSQLRGTWFNIGSDLLKDTPTTTCSGNRKHKRWYVAPVDRFRLQLPEKPRSDRDDHVHRV